MFTTEEIMKIALDMIDIDYIPADSAIYHPGGNIKKVLMGIDMGVPELLLARELGYDAVIAHHPQGAILSFYQILDDHIDQMVEAGVPRKEAEKVVEDLKLVNELRGHSSNFDHAASVARLIDIPYLNIHYPLDQLGRKRMRQVIAEKTDENSKVADVIAALNTLPEFKKAETEIKLRVGKPDNKAGKIIVSHGAGTNGGYDLAHTYYQHGVDTLIYIHIAYPDLKKIQAEEAGNLIISGHISSDLVGINPYIERLEASGLIVDRISGL